MAEDNLKFLQRIKDEIDKARSARDNIAGQLENEEARLRKEFGVGTWEEAEQLIAELEEQIERLGQQIEEGVQAIKEEWEV